MITIMMNNNDTHRGEGSEGAGRGPLLRGPESRVACVYIYIYIYICIHTYVCVYVYIYIYIYTYVRVYTLQYMIVCYIYI